MVGTGYLVGRFDMVNIRDLDLIAQASQACEQLVLLVPSDELSLAMTGRLPVVPVNERVAIAAELQGVDSVVTVESTSLELDSDAVLFAADDEVLPAGWDAARLSGMRTSASAILRRWQAPAVSGAA
ncbi:hypothetical protein [Propioniciclava soli]|uniref:Cytidyltransferase-like domain-containing protein n=1 Tax=Propioniciclava soli TaxID=2775081 RepID=A0ABZ3C6P8_9ACTN|nr:hypothetical protein [Propioniciclava soli]